jgi:hypothetical protein
MESRVYGFTPGGKPAGGQGLGAAQPSTGTPQRSMGVYNVEPRRAAAPAVHRADAFTGTQGWGDYDPSGSPDDPHDEPFDDIDDDLKPVDGDVPDNIIGDGDIGDADAGFDADSLDGSDVPQDADFDVDGDSDGDDDGD